MPETSISLRQLVEAKYDAGAKKLTLDGTSFGDQVANLLLLSSVTELSLTEVTLTPALGTSPTPDTWHLTGATTLWGTASSLTIAVSPGTSNVAEVEVTGTIPTITLQGVTEAALALDASQTAGLGSVVLSNGAFSASEPAGTLIYGASLTDSWSPFGLHQVQLESVKFGLVVISDPDWGLTQKAILKANLVINSGSPIPVEIDVPIGGGAWSIGIVPPGVTIDALSAIAGLLGGSSYQDALPAKLVQMTTLDLQSLILQFDPSGPSWSAIDLNIGTANAWPIATGIEIESVDLALRVRPQNVPMVGGTATGTFKIDVLEFYVSVPLPLTGQLDIVGRTTQPLPGFKSFASLVDVDFAASLPDGIADLGAFQIHEMSLSYDLDNKFVSALSIQIASANPWTLIPNHLVLDDLFFGINAQKGGGSWIVQGIASGTILINDVRVGLSVQGGAGSWGIKLTEPLFLPNLGQIVDLFGGSDASSALPGGFGDGVGALTIYRYEMAFGGATNSLQNLSLSFGTSNPWKFWDPYFVLQSLSVDLSVAGPTGTRTLDANIQGVLEVDSINLIFSATKPASGDSWTFAGAMASDDDIDLETFLAYLAKQLNVTPPTAISQFAIIDLGATFVTGSNQNFTFHTEGQFEIAGQVMDLILHFAIASDGGKGTTLEVEGDLNIGPAHFNLTFDKTPGSSRLTATWDQANKPIGFADIANAFGFDPPDIPEGLDLTLTSAGFSYDFDPKLGRLILDATSQHYGQFTFVSELLNGERIYLFDFQIPLNIKLSEVPLAGEYIPQSLDVGIQSLEITYASELIAAPDLVAINTALGVIQAKAISQPSLPQGMSFSGALLLGGTQQLLSLPVTPSPTPPTPTTTQLAVNAKTAPPAYSGSGKWIDIGKNFGPFQIDRIGVQYQNGVLMFALDAGIALGPLAFSMDGLAIGSPLTEFSPVFNIDGLGLAYNQPPIEISGTILRIPASQLASTVKLQFDGFLILKTGDFSLSAIGSYAQMETGGTSLFVFAQIEEPLGGPPAFFVTGLMAGFGYNRALTIPSQDEVEDFPLFALGQSTAAQDPTTVLGYLEGTAPLNGVQKAWIAPQMGQYWLAAGLEFTSFEIVRTKALLVVEFGNDLEIALLGLSTLQLPQPEESSETYAFVEMMIRVVIQPSQGVFAASAILSKSSYVITPSCHLTGGFAFYLWFGSNPHAGEFVTTLGGYHPAFKPPSYYPQVPRLGFNWAVSDLVTIKGDAYFALTASCVMAGGGLEVLFHDGRLNAWFTAQADFLVSWRPFFYTADISVSVGVSYRLNLLFCDKTVSVSLGASAKIWGPPTAGTVYVDFYIISFTVSFGSGDEAQETQPLGWSDFQTLLPSASAVCRIVAGNNLYKTIDSKTDSTKLWVVRANGFSFSTQSAIPASHVQFGDETPVQIVAGGINIRPMNMTGVVSTHNLTVSGPGPADASKWSLTPTLQGMPESLWGAPPSPFTNTPSQPAANLVTGLATGYSVVTPPPAIGSTRGAIELKVLLEEYLSPGVSPLLASASPSFDYLPVFENDSVGLIAQVASKNVSDSRNSLYELLSSGNILNSSVVTNGDLSQLSAQAAHIYSASPMLQK